MSDPITRLKNDMRILELNGHHSISIDLVRTAIDAYERRGYIPLSEWAAKHGASVASAHRWARQGLIEVVCDGRGWTPGGGGRIWIHEDTQRPEIKIGRPTRSDDNG